MGSTILYLLSSDQLSKFAIYLVTYLCIWIIKLKLAYLFDSSNQSIVISTHTIIVWNGHNTIRELVSSERSRDECVYFGVWAATDWLTSLSETETLNELWYRNNPLKWLNYLYATPHTGPQVAFKVHVQPILNYPRQVLVDLRKFLHVQSSI